MSPSADVASSGATATLVLAPPISARIGFQASDAAIRTDQASAAMIHAPNDPNQLRHQCAMKPPQIPAALLRVPSKLASVIKPSTTGNSSAAPAKKTSHERSVSDFMRPNRRSAWTAGTNGTRIAAGHPKNETSGPARKSPTAPTLALTFT